MRVKYIKLLMKRLSTMTQVKVMSVDAVEKAVRCLNEGLIIAIPTDTVYGVACSAGNINAISKLYNIKSRHESKPLAICLNEIADVKDWAKVNHLPNGLLKDLLPGKVTLVLQCKHKLDDFTTSVDGKVGIRIPDNKFIREVVREHGHPIALTSANVSGSPSSLSINEFSALWDDLDCIFDQGLLGTSAEQRNGSTVIDFSCRDYYRILREGVALDEVTTVCKKYNLKMKEL